MTGDRIVLNGFGAATAVRASSNVRVHPDRLVLGTGGTGGAGRPQKAVARASARVPAPAPAPESSDDWQTHEVMPGVELRVRPGLRIGVQPVGTSEIPVFLVTPGQAVGVQPTGVAGMVETVYTGLLPLLALIAKPVAKAVGKALMKKRTNNQPQTSGHDPDQLQPGDITEINGIQYQCAGFDQAGAVLIDSDGKRAVV